MSDPLAESSIGASGDDQLGASEAGGAPSQKSVEGTFSPFNQNERSYIKR